MATNGSLNLENGLKYKLKVFIPTLVDMRDQKMVTVDVKGDPNKQTGTLMKPLYAHAYSIRKIFKDKGKVFKVEKLRGRWPDENAQIGKDKWTGIYGLPVPDDVSGLAEVKKEKLVPGVDIKLETWKYGKVGMILHVGSYAEETPTIQKLHDYVTEQGYKIIPNSHEEVYVSDPSKTPPDKMKTLLLCRVKK